MIGTKFAHHEIISHIGTGGMGEVYQAIDSKLGLSVAIKLSPAAFASDADRFLLLTFGTEPIRQLFCDECQIQRSGL